MTTTAAEKHITPRGDFVELDGEALYRIRDYDRLPPFLMTIVSASDQWLFLSSTGALTAGRGNPDQALFPYETEDRIHRSAGRIGPYTLLRCARPNGDSVLWEPFTGPADQAGRRSLYKTALSDRVRFEERRVDLGLTFAYEWGLSDEYGFVRRATLRADDSAAQATDVGVLDGLRYLLPHGLDARLQQTASGLGDAYKHSELDADTGLAIYSLTSYIVDRPEPAEALRASVAWSIGLPNPVRLLWSDQIDAFRSGRELTGETLSTGRPGDYLVSFKLRLEPAEAARWTIGADAARTQSQVVELAMLLQDAGGLADRLAPSIAENRRQLRAHVARADGLSAGGEDILAARHAANALFNCMRGGVLADHRIALDDLSDFVRTRNRGVHEHHRGFFESLPAQLARADLIEAAERQGDVSLLRLCSEYLPLTFSRRHGDPSRPWNRFHINVRNPDGSRRLDYEGNWRDVFQNWEALTLSFPDYIESTVALFVNATTVDGYNPYRLTRAGIDWEVPDPDDPWSHIGYWGDHQIIYLLKLLESSVAHHDGAIARLLQRPIFAYADVPYRLGSYDELLADPHHTIAFDVAQARVIDDRVARLGGDGKLVHDETGRIRHVTLAEKLLVPLLSKISNLVIDAGIWMNTQRPEWNDANNALVGFGVSMVTQAYLHRYVRFCEGLFAGLEDAELDLSAPVADWLARVSAILIKNRGLLESLTVSDLDRRRVLDALGRAFADYRAIVYENGLSGPVKRPVRSVLTLLSQAGAYLEHGLRAARRDDGLFDAYSLIDIDDIDRATVERLEPMLEGQVAVLSTDLLESDDVSSLVDTLFDSALYRGDQDTFLLYPDRVLPRFLERNRVPADRVDANALLRRLIEAGEGRVITRDARGDCRFQSDLRNANDLSAALDELAIDPEFSQLVPAQRKDVLDVWEAVFDHRAFTGRSSRMYGYEGLGSVYWHMVSKLLLAIQERFFAARDAGADEATLRRVAERYYRVRRGLGVNKTIVEYGAFPTDAYSHTPPDGQARQPGMTGQVKEDILARRGELGVRVSGGCLRFDPILLRRSELLAHERAWRFVGLDNREHELSLGKGSLGFTVCQVPVVYRLAADAPCIELTRPDGGREVVAGARLSAASSALVFERTGAIVRIDVALLDRQLLLT